MDEIMVDRYFRAIGNVTGNVYAIGDITDVLETKQAITLFPKIKLLSHNILHRIIGDIFDNDKMQNDKYLLAIKKKYKKMKPYKMTMKPTIYLPIGMDDGISTGNCFIHGAKYTKKIKGEDLFITHFTKILTS